MINKESVLKELRRELEMRRSLYPRWVNQGKLTQKTADHRIEAIEYAINIVEQQPDTPVASESTNRTQLSLLGEEQSDRVE